MEGRSNRLERPNLGRSIDYTRTLENEILPLLRKQKGFKDEITLSNPGSMDVITISLWDSKANAGAYNTDTYPEVLKTLARMIASVLSPQAGNVIPASQSGTPCSHDLSVQLPRCRWALGNRYGVDSGLGCCGLAAVFAGLFLILTRNK